MNAAYIVLLTNKVGQTSVDGPLHHSQQEAINWVMSRIGPDPRLLSSGATMEEEKKLIPNVDVNLLKHQDILWTKSEPTPGSILFVEEECVVTTIQGGWFRSDVSTRELVKGCTYSILPCPPIHWNHHATAVTWKLRRCAPPPRPCCPAASAANSPPRPSRCAKCLE